MTTQVPGGRQAVVDGRATLGIELGSSRIKAVLIDEGHRTLATGVHAWENQLVDGRWTYCLDAVWLGVQDCYRSLVDDVERAYGVPLERVAALGVSGMMHGYLAFDTDDELLVEFRTWRNTSTGPAAERLSEVFDHNVPHRWSVAHLYQAVLDHEDHVGRVAFLTTLAGYVHWRLSGHKIIGIGDASGMFPVDTATGDYDGAMIISFDRLVVDAGTPLRVAELLPTVRVAGEPGGRLTATGARLLDPSGRLSPGAPLCPPEGDAGTGMVATGSVAPRTGNVSAGTSIFAMVVLEHALQRRHRELDLVTTPAGDPVAMVHCNNGASEIDGWVGLFVDFAQRLGIEVAASSAYETLFAAALDGAADCGGMLAFNYLAGEPITGLDEGRPLFLRTPGSSFDLPTFVRTQLYAVLATLRIGMDVLQRDEAVALDRMFAHGGLFSTPGVVQQLLAGAIDTPVTTARTASQGGAWGIAALAAYMTQREPGESLAAYLQSRVFADEELVTRHPEPRDVTGFDAFVRRYVAALPVQQAAVTAT